MKHAYALVPFIFCSMLQAADTKRELFHQRIEHISQLLLKNHTDSANLDSISIETQDTSSTRYAKQVALHIQNHYALEKAMDFIEAFDWKHGKRSDAPKGTRQMGRLILFLNSANKVLDVTKQEMSDDGNILTTFERPISFKALKQVFQQVPTTGGFSTFEKSPSGIVSTSTGMYWDIKSEE